MKFTIQPLATMVKFNELMELSRDNLLSFKRGLVKHPNDLVSKKGNPFEILHLKIDMEVISSP